jgi:hypothetical protein
MRTMSKGTWAFIGSIIIVAAIIVVVSLRSFSPFPEAPAPATPSISPTASTTATVPEPPSPSATVIQPNPLPGSTTYINTAYSYSIQYPSDWACSRISPTSSLNYVVDRAVTVGTDYNCGQSGPGGFINITATPLPAAVKQASSEEGMLRAFLAGTHSQATVLATQEILLDGHPALVRNAVLSENGHYANVSSSVYVTNWAYIYQLSLDDTWTTSSLRAYGTGFRAFPSDWAAVISTFHLLSASANAAQ